MKRKIKYVLSGILLLVVCIGINCFALAKENEVAVLDERWKEETSYTWSGTRDIVDDEYLHVHGKSEQVAVKNSDVKFPSKFTYEFRAKINQYASSTNRAGTLAAKMSFDNQKRLMFSIERDGLYGSNKKDTWTKLSDYKAGTEWHEYRFEINLEEGKADLFIDDASITELTLQERADGNIVQYFREGQSENETSTYVDYTRITYEPSKEDLPVWNANKKLSVQKTRDSVRLEWTKAQGNVTEYHIYKDGRKLESVDADQTEYEIKGLPSSHKFAVQIQASNENGETTDGPKREAKTAYNPQEDKLDISEVFVKQPGTKYSYGYRIPGIVVTKRNTILAYTEARKTGSDWAPMDLLMRRSVDGGETWEEYVVVEGLESGNVINNPVMIVDKNNKIHLLYCEQYGVENLGGGVYYMSSEDDGKTWTAPQDISTSFFTDEFARKVVALGPGHGIQLSNGRLIVPIWMANGKDDHDHQPSVVSTIYSDDYGKTWEMGEVIFANDQLPNPNETTIVELSDKRVMLNIRSQTGKKRRAVAISEDGSTNWSKPVFDETLVDPGCFGSLVRYDEQTILFSNASNDSARKNGTIRVSFDDGKTWTFSRVIEGGSFAYSDVAVDQNKTIYVLFEDQDNGTDLYLARFSLDWIKEGSKDKLQSLKASEGTFDKKFSPDQYNYILDVEADTKEVTLSFETVSKEAVVYVDGVQAEGNQVKVTLDGKNKTVSLAVQNGELKQQYQIKIRNKAKRNTLVAGYHFDDEMQKDFTEYGNDLNVGNAEHIADGRFAQAAWFDGTDSYLEVSDTRGVAFGTEDFSVSMWTKFEKTVGTQFLAWYGTNVSNSSQWWLRNNDGKLQFAMSDGGETVLTTEEKVIRENEWQHIVISREKDTMSIYVDGTCVAQKTGVPLYNVNGLDVLRIGKEKSGANRTFKGALDEFRVYNFALSEQQIEILYDSGLQELITYAKAQTEKEDYDKVVPAVREALERELAEAIAVNENAGASKDEMEKAYEELLAIVQMLEFQGDAMDLRLAVTLAKAIDTEGKTEESVAALNAAIKAAEAVLANENALQDEIDKALNDLNGAVAGLEDKPAVTVNKEKLKELLDNSKRYEERIDEYTDATANAFLAALTGAREVYENPEATQEEVNQAYVTLRQAIFGLREIPSKDKLEDLIKEAEKIDFSKYTEESAQAVKAALARANAVKEDQNATTEEVEEAEQMLRTALDGLHTSSVPDENGEKKAAKTGDDMNPVLPMIMGIMAVFAVLSARKRK